MMRSSQVHSEDGSPGLYIDGQKVVPILYGLSDIPGSSSNTAQAQRNIKAFADQNIRYVTADTDLRLGWHKHSPFEVEPMVEEIAGVLQANPDAGVLLRLHLNTPYWWMRDYPEETVLYLDKPGIDNGETQRLIRDDASQHMRTSLASRRWLQEAGQLLAQFCREVWDTPEGRAVIGIQVACGIYGEWHQWGMDCSQPMKTRFRAYLREKYGTDAALRQAWGDPCVTIDTAHFVPDVSRAGDDGSFRDPVLSRDTMDAQYCIQLTVTEAITHFCRIVKENWGRPVLAGTFYGYYVGTGGDRSVISGHLLIHKLYEQRQYIDLLCGPFPYYPQNRSPQGVPLSRGLLESNRLRGMLWLTEMDQHPAGTENILGGDPARMDETVAQLRRNVLLPLLAGMGCWYYDHRLIPAFVDENSKNPYAGSMYRKSGWWESPALMKEIGRLWELARQYALRPYRAAADVLVVFDPLSRFAQSHVEGNEYGLLDAIARAGAAYDCIYLHELPKADLARYRCVIFVNAYRLTPAQRAEIGQCTQGKQRVWMYAPGFSDDRTLDPQNIQATIGMTVSRTEAQLAFRICPPFPAGTVEYPAADLAPLFAIEDEQAQTVAKYVGSEACAAARKGDDWYFALPMLNQQLARTIFEAAGAHIYCVSGDPILAGAGLVAINSFGGGKREITLRSGKQIVCQLPPMTTRVWDAETGETLLA